MDILFWNKILTTRVRTAGVTAPPSAAADDLRKIYFLFLGLSFYKMLISISHSRSILLISRQYRRHFHNQHEILYILVMSNLNFDTLSKNRIFRSIVIISKQYRRHFHNQREILQILVPSNFNFDNCTNNSCLSPLFFCFPGP